MPVLPIGTVMLLTLKGEDYRESTSFDSFVFARFAYLGLRRFSVTTQRPKLDPGFDDKSDWVALPAPVAGEKINGYDNPFWIIEPFFEEDIDMADLEVVEISFSGPSKSSVWEFATDYLSRTEYSNPPLFEFEQVFVDGSVLVSNVEGVKLLNEKNGDISKIQRRSRKINPLRESALPTRSKHALVSRAACSLVGIVTGPTIDPVLDDEEPFNLLVPGANGTDYSFTNAANWLVCDPGEVEAEHWDELPNGRDAYWTSVSHYVPKLRLEDPADFSDEVRTRIRARILGDNSITDSCRAALLLSIAK